MLISGILTAGSAIHATSQAKKAQKDYMKAQERNEAMKAAKREEMTGKLREERFAGAAHFKSYYGQKEQGVLGLGSSGEEDSGGGWPT